MIDKIELIDTEIVPGKVIINTFRIDDDYSVKMYKWFYVEGGHKIQVKTASETPEPVHNEEFFIKKLTEFMESS